MVRAFWRKLFPVPPVIEQFEKKIAELNERADRLVATIDDEREWFLRCHKDKELITCTSVPKSESDED